MTVIVDPNLFLGSFEIHHFYYGLMLLIMTSFLLLFQRGHRLFHSTLVGISVGLILDELIFVGTKIRGPLEYGSTWPYTILIVVILMLLTEAVWYFCEKLKNQ